MKRTLLTPLRDEHCSQKDFRFYAERLADELAFDLLKLLPKEEVAITTLIQETTGSRLKGDLLLVPILRSGLAMLFPFLRLFHDAKVGFLGMKRDEETFLPTVYYEKIPPIDKSSQVVILDPMIATGGSSKKAIELLLEKGTLESHIWIVSFVASSVGIHDLKKSFPKIRLLVGEEDPLLNDHKFIVPGLGDFGDRYFT